MVEEGVEPVSSKTVSVPRPFVSDTSLKRIDREGLGKRRTGTRQVLPCARLSDSIVGTY